MARKNRQLYYWVKESQHSDWEPAFYNGTVYTTFPSPSHGVSLRRLPEEFFAIDPTPFFRALSAEERVAIARHMLQMLADKFALTLQIDVFLDNQQGRITLTVMAPGYSSTPYANHISEAFSRMVALWADPSDYGLPVVDSATLLSDTDNIALAKSLSQNAFTSFVIN